MKTFGELAKLAAKGRAGAKKVRLAILADSATQLFSQALRGTAADLGWDLDIYEGAYDQVEGEILDPTSELYTFRPEFVIVWRSSKGLLPSFQAQSVAQRARFAEDQIDVVQNLCGALASRGAPKVLVFTCDEIDDGVFGHFSSKTATSWPYQVRQYNTRLMDLARAQANVFLVDVARVAADYGTSFVFDRRLAMTASTLFTLDFLPIIAKHTLDVMGAITGRFKKCLILDLDNTVWGGVIGDDGMENIEIGPLGLGPVYSELQRWARDLKDRGIILAVSSKNDSKIASEPFQKHPDMVLRLEDIAVFQANWESKVANIRHIQSILEIGFDSMVFLDDNPAERDVVRQNIPDVCVPELPEDPVDWLPYLRRLNLFETASLSDEDGARTARYREEAERREFQTAFESDEAFLESLAMTCAIEGFTRFNLPRVAQLTQRSNQFNLRTVRYSEADLARIAASEDHVPLAFSLKDKFGAYGLISVVILVQNGNELFIDTWLMSCRVLKRRVEDLVLNTIVEKARERGLRFVVGEYLPTPKNGLVKEHYASLGFRAEADRWYLDTPDYVPHRHFTQLEPVGRPDEERPDNASAFR